jgi:hypothetical protein
MRKKESSNLSTPFASKRKNRANSRKERRKLSKSCIYFLYFVARKTGAKTVPEVLSVIEEFGWKHSFTKNVLLYQYKLIKRKE